MASIQEVIEQWKRALNIEVNHQKTEGGEKLPISDGKCLRRHEKGAAYWFLLASNVLLPESTPIRIEHHGLSYLGRTVAVDGYDVILELDTYFGDEIDEAFLISEPWELLVALSKRLDDINENITKQNRVKRLMSGKSPAKHPTDKIKNAVQEAALRAKYNPATYIWGPPGTGKTYTLARMIAQHYFWGKKILVMAHSNAAVDVLLLELATFIQKKQLWKPGEIIRYGFSADPKVREQEDLLSGKLVEMKNPQTQAKIKSLEAEKARLLQNKTSPRILAQTANELNQFRAKIKQEETQYVQQASVIGVTLSKAAVDPLIYEQDYDLVVVDEVSMAYIPQVAFASSLGKRIVVCGDFKQLPPIAMAESKLVEKWLKRDIFYGAKIVDQVEQGHPNLLMLKEQRRMHPEISSFTNSFIYKNKVYDHETALKKRQAAANKHPFPKEAAALVDLSQMGAYCLKESASDSRFNLMSALLSMQLILSGKTNGFDSIGYIAPYKAQARLLAALIQDLIPEDDTMAATVHKFQGSERDMIVFDYTDSFPRTRPGVLFTEEKSDRLINVAVTRARGKFITIADRQYMETKLPKNKASRALMEHLSNTYTYMDLPPLLKETYTQNLKWFSDHTRLLNDISSAREIIISAPIPSKIDRTIWDAVQMKKPTIITMRKEAVPLQSFDVLPIEIAMPFIILDGEILWAGTLEAIKARLVSKRVIKLFTGYLNLQSSAKYSHQEVQQKMTSYRLSFTLRQYINSWDQCPVCRSRRRAETTPAGKILLICSHCGNKGWVSRFLLQKYIDHIDLRCRTCNEPFEATGEGRNVGAECSRCEEKVEVNTLW